MRAFLARQGARLSLYSFLIGDMVRLQEVIADKDEIILKQLQIINRQKETLRMVVEQRDALMARETEG